MILTEQYIDLWKQLIRLQKSVEGSYRSLILLMAVSFLSACNQQQPQSIPQNETGFSKQETTSDAIYGRQAVFSYPDFSGEYKVASQSMILFDLARYEPFEQDSISNRKLHVRFYYPMEATNDDQVNQPLLPVISENAWDYLVGPHQVAGKQLRFDNYQTAKWDISLGSPIAENKTNFPVLIFSHGYGYSAESYSALSAELASMGYIVVSINHTYGANPSDFGRQDVVWAEPLPSDSIGAYLPIWSDDQMFVIDQLTIINSESSSGFYNKMDLTNLGIFGHSYGGAAAYHSASRDPRIKAVIDIDGTIFDFENTYIEQPFAFILSKDHLPKFDYQFAENDAFEIRFNSFKHISFTDHILWWQWDHDDKDLGLGKVDAHRAVELVSQITADFFAKYLISENSDWFDENEITTSEITLVRKN